MAKDFLMVKHIDFIIAVRRIKLLGIAITVGIIAVYLFGLTVSGSNHRENFEIVNFLSLILLIVLILISFLVKNMLLKKVNLSNFESAFFNAYIFPYAVLDFGALFCISTNLFVNENILYATFGVLLSVITMFLFFPKEEYFENIRNDTIQSDTASVTKDKD